jgi:hypothetical protein
VGFFAIPKICRASIKDPSPTFATGGILKSAKAGPTIKDTSVSKVALIIRFICLLLKLFETDEARVIPEILSPPRGRKLVLQGREHPLARTTLNLPLPDR